LPAPAWAKATRPRAANFHKVNFGGLVEFHQTWFTGTVELSGARFDHQPWLDEVYLDGDANFSDARFADTERLGPFVVTGTLKLDRAAFDRPIRIEAAASAVLLLRTTFAGDATLRLRHAKVVLDSVTTTGPLTITAAPPFPATGRPGEIEILSEDRVDHNTDGDSSPRLLALAGVDASRLVLSEVDLRACRFTGSYNLEQVRIEGPDAPSGWKVRRGWPPLWRWTRRQTLVEEHAWRASTRQAAPWPGSAPLYNPPESQLAPERLAGLYRQLRKAHEDAKNEPGAADFYYGEMEMRRHAATPRSAERALLTAYWAISGYGLRATRTLTALLILLVLGTVGFATVGFAASSRTEYRPASLTTTGQPAVYRQVTVPAARPGWTAAVDQSLDSATALLRATQPRSLTPIGRAIEITLRLLGPLLLGLAVLAVRGRVKR
jgi:hypothetical protein